MTQFRDLFPSPKPIIGVIHLPALPGYPMSKGIDHAIEKALADLAALEAGGADGALVENEYDRPHTVLSAPETTAAMTRVTREVVAAARRCIVGVEILLNDPTASLAVARATGARFIRTDYFVDPMERPEHGGAMHIDPEGLMSYRARIGAEDVLVLADIQVKYARMLVPRGLDESARLAREHRADAAIVSGNATGEPPAVADLALAKQGAGNLPILIGSGTDIANGASLLSVADGAVVGTSLKLGDHIAVERVKALVALARGLAPRSAVS
ncbi:MAG TPA: BtpA/SgcQ family protein [Hypericibacter adhaerens]|jgi:membrane complex biogenesis BtpA family protein|uniref:BtpA/SgcQ family protein n=1 Tax=Hypericibacter adhaerens TaxID=2602016 RepID=UPI002C505C37|nr:BtpA/SgcQ family protein [Hypericibacter adhaerens]HWA46547.1 BtpA/SgcQ family protein [Hypericibacter adhaerens]